MNKLDTQQTALFSKLKNNLEELQKQQTDSIDKKMIAIDASMEKEITRVMQKMAEELTAITGEFVKQYKDLTTKLNDLIEKYEKLQRSKQP